MIFFKCLLLFFYLLSDGNKSKNDILSNNDLLRVHEISKKSSCELSMKALAKSDVDTIISSEDIYSNKISPIEFLHFLSRCHPMVGSFCIDPRRIPKNWVKREDVFELALFIENNNKCTEVHNALLSMVYKEKFTSTVSMESRKLINMYFTGKYPSKPEMTKNELKSWIAKNK